jgi:hypothetical protein
MPNGQDHKCEVTKRATMVNSSNNILNICRYIQNQEENCWHQIYFTHGHEPDPGNAVIDCIDFISHPYPLPSPNDASKHFTSDRTVRQGFTPCLATFK